MRKLPAIALTALSAALLAGTAIAADRNSHIINVALPDGSTARVEYVGNVAPKVTIEPATNAGAEAGDSDDDWAVPNFAAFDRMMTTMRSENEAIMRQAQTLQRQQATSAAPQLAGYGNGSFSSTSVISYSNGSGTCTRTTEEVSQGSGKAPKVTSSVSGNCGSSAAPSRPQASSAPISRT